MSSNDSTMSLDEIIYNLAFKELRDDSVANISRVNFYCSFVNYVSEDITYRLQSDEELDYIRSLCEKKESLAWVVTWLCLVMGIPGNIAAIATMATMPKSTGTFYILVLAVSDMLALGIKTIDHFLEQYHVVYSSFTCKFFTAMTNCSIIYANWILVFISLERFITVQFPLQKRYYFTMSRAKISAFVLSLVIAPLGIVDFLAIEWGSVKCTYTTPHMKMFYKNVWLHVLNALYSFFPAGLILVFVLLVTMALRRQQKERSLMMGHRGSQRENGAENEMLKRQRLDVQKAERAITIMMFVTLVVFLVITLPVCIVIIVILSVDEQKRTPSSDAQEKLLLRVALALTMLSHAINFYLYFLSARKFREHLYALLKKCYCRSKVERMDLSKNTECDEIH